MLTPRTVLLPFDPAAPPHTGRCFRTAADGRIALSTDWLALLRATRLAGPFAVQTRHRGARLIGSFSTPELAAHPSAARLHDESASLHCCLPRWAQAWGWLRACDCCGSPGRVEVHRAGGGEFLQFTALPDSSPLAWSDYLSTLAATPTAPIENPKSKIENPSVAPSLPQLIRADLRTPFHLDALVALLRAFGDESLPVCFTLRTAEVAHRRDLVPREVSVVAAFLSVSEPGSCAQLAWPLVHALAIAAGATGPALHLLGADDGILLSLSAATDPVAAAAWRHALRSAFPTLPLHV